MGNICSELLLVKARALLHDGDDDGDFHGACDGREFFTRI